MKYHSLMSFFILITLLCLSNCLLILNHIDRHLDNLLSVRMLQQENKSENESGDIHLIMVLVALGLVFGGGCLMCIVCFIRKILSNEHGANFFIGTKIANTIVNYENLFPSISYQTFAREVGVPLQDTCVICLQEFSEKVQSTGNQNRKESEENLDKSKDKRMMKKRLKPKGFMVKYTVCGHLLHEKCLNNWLQRQQNCPLCRQPFDYFNCQVWSEKLELKFNRKQFNKKKQIFKHQLAQHSVERKKMKNKKNQLYFTPPIENSNSPYKCEVKEKLRHILTEENSQISQKAQISEDLHDQQLYGIYIYSKIHDYHLSRRNEDDQFSEENGLSEVVHNNKQASSQNKLEDKIQNHVDSQSKLESSFLSSSQPISQSQQAKFNHKGTESKKPLQQQLIELDESSQFSQICDRRGWKDKKKIDLNFEETRKNDSKQRMIQNNLEF